MANFFGWSRRIKGKKREKNGEEKRRDEGTEQKRRG